MTADRQARRLTPAFRLALFAALLLAGCLAGPGRWIGVATVGAIAAVACLGARVRLRVLLARLAPLVSFVALAFALLLLAPVPAGTPTVRLPLIPHDLPRAGLSFVLAIVVKSALVVALATAFTRWLSEREFLAALGGLRIPGKVAALLYLMVRSLRDVRDEALLLTRARDSRGKPRGLRALRTAAALSQVLIIRLGQRADLRAAALVSRGFRNRLPLVGAPTLAWHEGACVLAAGALLVWVATL